MRTLLAALLAVSATARAEPRPCAAWAEDVRSRRDAHGVPFDREVAGTWMARGMARMALPVADDGFDVKPPKLEIFVDARGRVVGAERLGKLKRGDLVAVIADRAAPARPVLELLSAAPAGVQLGLAVRKPAADVVDRHVKREPATPAWLPPVLAEALDAADGTRQALLGTAKGTALMIRVDGACPAVAEVWRKLGIGGAGLDATAPALADAALACRCRFDRDAALSLLLFLNGLERDFAWRPILSAPSDLAATATVDDLARAAR